MSPRWPRPPGVEIVAELAQSYEGLPEEAERLIRAAAAATADAVKFQIFLADELAVPGYQYYELYRTLELPLEEWARLVDLAHRLGLRFYADVFGLETARSLQRLRIDAYKIHAADMINRPLLEAVGRTGRPVLLSCGGSLRGEIVEALALLRGSGASEVCLMHGFQAGPTAPEDSHIARLRALAELGAPVALADHIAGDHPLAPYWPLLGVAAGASVIEKHFALRRADRKEDWVSALEPDEFRTMAGALRLAASAVGTAEFEMPPAEREYRAGFRKRVVAARDLRAGSELSAEDLTLLRVPGEEGAFDPRALVGRSLIRDVRARTPIAGDAVRPRHRPRVVATLPCRNASNRLYAKPLQRLGELTILDYLVARLRSVRRIDEIVLAISEGIENEIFVGHARRLGLRAIVGDERDVQQRLIDAGQAGDADHLVRVTTECPFVHVGNLDELIEAHITAGAALSVCEGLPEGTYAEIIDLRSLKDAHDRGEARHRSELSTLYLFEHPERYRLLRVEAPAGLRRPEIRLTVDYPEDLIVCRAVAEALGANGMLFSLEDIIVFLDAHPEIMAINSWISAGTGRIWR